MKYIIAVLAFTILSMASKAQAGSVKTQIYQEKGVAIKGYDPVAYFTEKQAMAGDQSISMDWEGAKWMFVSKENMEIFKKNPEKYVPQYGGYCAYGVSENHKSPTDPNAWTVVGDKLYLNYNLKVKEIWLKDIPVRIEKADKNWKTLEKVSN